MEFIKSYGKLMAVITFTLIFFTALGWLFKPVDKFVDRKVMVNSHQYIEGMQQRAAILRANIAEVDAMIASGQGDRENLSAQRRALSAQLNAITMK